MSTERYWLDVIAKQAEKAVAAWESGHMPDADLLSLQNQLRCLDRARQHANPPRTQPEFGQWIAQRRCDCRETQGALAARLGLDRTTVNKIERGKHGVSWDLGWKLVEATQSPSDPIIELIARGLGAVHWWNTTAA